MRARQIAHSSSKRTIDDSIAVLRAAADADFDAATEAVRSHLPRAKKRIIRALRREEDERIRSTFVELLDDLRDPKLIPLFASELQSTSKHVKFCAYIALQNIATREAQEILSTFMAETKQQTRK